jgi:hypothetical protein
MAAGSRATPRSGDLYAAQSACLLDEGGDLGDALPGLYLGEDEGALAALDGPGGSYGHRDNQNLKPKGA